MGKKPIETSSDAWHGAAPTWDATFEFIASLVSSGIWPVVFLIVALRYRSSISDILKNIKKLSFAGAEATFENEMKTVIESSQAIEEPSPRIRKENDIEKEALLKEARKSPTGAIINSWNAVESESLKLIEKSDMNFYSEKYRPYFSIQKAIQNNNLLPKAEIKTFQELRQIRNRVAHSMNDKPTVEQAIQYVEISDKLIDSIRSITNPEGHYEPE